MSDSERASQKPTNPQKKIQYIKNQILKDGLSYLNSRSRLSARPWPITLESLRPYGAHTKFLA